MAATPIYGKNPFKILLLWHLTANMSFKLDMSATKFVQMMTLDLPLTFLRKGLWFLIVLHRKINNYTVDFSETNEVYNMKVDIK